MGDNADGLSIYSVVQVGNGGMPGMITNEFETFWLGNLESEIVGEACGALDRGGLSKNGPKK